MFSRIGVLLLAMRDYAYRMVYSIPVNRQHTAPGTSYVQRNCELGWTSDDRSVCSTEYCSHQYHTGLRAWSITHRRPQRPHRPSDS